jgi:hypothetical protein
MQKERRSSGISETVLNPLPRLKDSDFRDKQVSFLGEYWAILAQK